MSKTYLSIVMLCLLFVSCKEGSKEKKTTDGIVENIVPTSLKWSERMALSEIHRFPDPTLLDFRKEPGWSYTNGLVLQAVSKVYDQNQDQKLYDYIYDYGNRMINEDGSINTYKLKNYNLDMIKSGDPTFYLFQKTQEPRFKMAMDTLHLQLEGQPTTSEGGYWHKKRYPYQMWLDGVFMAEPFHTKYALEFMDVDSKV